MTPASASLKHEHPTRVGLQSALLILLTLLAYLPALRAGFIWDDDSMLTENPFVQAADGWRAIWFSTELPDYFPLTSTSLWLEWRLWGLNPAGYHATNVLLHGASALLLWRVLRRLRIPGAWVAALVFAVHPVNVQSVAWITERKNTLAMLFYLLTFLSYFHFEHTGRRAFYRAALGSFLLALLSKTAVVTLPVALLLCAWWQRGRIDRLDLLRTSPFFLLALVLGLVTIWFQYHRAIGGEVVQTSGFAGRLAGAGCAVWFYLFKALAPLNLSFVYPRWTIDPSTPIAYLPGAALAVLFATLWPFRRSWSRPVLFGLGYFVITLFPVLGFFKIYFQRYTLVSDHWQYFAIIGIIALAVAAGMRLIEWFTPRLQRIVRATAGGGVVLALSLLTWQQVRVYHDVETLWHDTLRKNPDCWLAHNNLGAELAVKGKADAAMRHYDEAARIAPLHAETYNNIGNLLAEQGRPEDAIPHYHRAIQVNSNYVISYFNLGVALAKAGRFDEAVDQYRVALELSPAYDAARNNLGVALFNRGEPDAAVEQYRILLRRNPNDFRAWDNLANALAALGHSAEAERSYRQALRLNPDYEIAWYDLGNLQAATGQPELAVASYESALKLRRDYHQARFNLAVTLTELGRTDAALPHLQQVAASETRDPELRLNLGRLLSQLGRRDDAIVQIRKALQLQPGYAEAEQALRTLGVPVLIDR